MDFYSNALKEVFPGDFGENLPFTTINGESAISGKDERVNGKRVVRMEVRSWVGTSAIGAVHYYGKLKTYSLGYIVNGEERFVSGYGDSVKPPAMNGLEITIVRPTTQRDIDYYLNTTSDDPDHWDFLCPKIGGYEHGFWTESELIEAAKEVFSKYFTKDWILQITTYDGETYEVL